MTTKQEKPTLAGVTLKTRKRNIVVPVDPASFANAVVAICQDSADAAGATTAQEELTAACKELENDSNLEFSRYGDTLFEVFFAGGMIAAGGKYVDEKSPKLKTHVLLAHPTHEAILPFVKVFASMTRRRPFLIRGLENTLIKLLLTMEFFDAEKRKKIAIAMALVFANKIAVVPENVFSKCFNDRLVTKGTMLEFMTLFFQEFISIQGISTDDLVSLLVKSKISSRLLDLFPPLNRSYDEFNKHFNDAGLSDLVLWNSKEIMALKINDLLTSLTDVVSGDQPASCADAIALSKSRVDEFSIPKEEVVRVCWLALMASINVTGKNQQQILQAIVAVIKKYHKLLSAWVTSGRLELQLLITIQCHCYEDNRLLKIFTDIVRMLYDADILNEDTIMHWYKKGSHPKGRNVFLKDAESFIQWLEEAEEDNTS